ncbi:hypothetical protein [Lentisalinibacter salinarum]|uniref:hypothetical protein n=1 Tax=Lentisalinibacter salinarum TaxID=2992239 RepID=UPI00386D67EF
MGKGTDSRLPAVREFLRRHEAGESVPDDLLAAVARYLRDTLPKGRGRPRGSTKIPQERLDQIAMQYYALTATWIGAPDSDVLESLAEQYGVEPETIRNYVKARAALLDALDSGEFPESMWSEFNAAMQGIAKKIPPI